MSIEAMNCAWNLDVTPNQKLLLLWLADNYGFNGFVLTHIVDPAAQKNGFAQTEVTALLEELLALDLIQPSGDGYTWILGFEPEKPNLHAFAERSERDTEGYVYLLCHETQPGVYKIGRTKYPDNRLKTFNVKLPFDVHFEWLIKCADMYALEDHLHARFAKNRIAGEWFNLSERDVLYIKRIGGES